MRAMFVFKMPPGSSLVAESDVKVREMVERDVRVEDGDEVVMLVVGKARVFAGGHEVEIKQSRIERIVEVRKP